MALARKRRLSPNGAAWFKGLHRPEMRMPQATITANVYYDTCPDYATVVDAIEEHIWPLYRFSSVVKNGEFVPVEGTMDRAYHIMEQQVANESEIDVFTQRVMSTPLDVSRPLWQMTILRSKQERSAIVIRINHAISDGLGLLFAFLPLMKVISGKDALDTIPLPAALLGKKKALQSDSSSKKKSLLWQAVLSLLGIFQFIVDFLRGILSLAIVKADSGIKLNAPLSERTPYYPYSGRHVFTRMPAVPLSVVKTIRSKHQCTVNDAIMAGLAGAIRKYCAEDLKDPLIEKAGHIECKATMLLALPRPISSEDAGASLCNNILTPIFRFPVGEPQPISRLQKTVAMANRLKSAPYILGIKLATQLLTSVVPATAMQKIASEAISKLTANVTSIPLPSEPMTFLGEEVKDVRMAFVNNVPQISLLTYNNFIYWTMVSDPALIPDPVAIGKHFKTELEVLAAA